MGCECAWVRVCVWVRACTRVCVCERERECVCVCVRYEYTHAYVHSLFATLPTLLHYTYTCWSTHAPSETRMRMCVRWARQSSQCTNWSRCLDGVAPISRLLKIFGLFAKEPYSTKDLEEPTNRSHLGHMQTTAHKEQRKARAGLLFANLPGYFTFNFFGCCDAATQLALQIQQERTQVVCGFGFWVVMPQHSQHSNYSYKWCEVRR